MDQIRRVGMYRESPGSDIVKQGYLKKLKTMRKKFFILRATSTSGVARLDYFDSEKKYKSNHPPKKSYQLHSFFNINKKIDSKHKFAIAIFLPTECFSVLADSQEEQDDWINKMLEYQNEYLPQGEEPRTHYEYVWQGVIKHKSPSSCSKISGPYRLCLSEKAVSLVKLSEYKPSYQFQFSSIRKCGAHEHFFLMEVGRSAVTGSGDIWLEVEGSHAAQNMHDVILSEMAASRAAEDPFRIRSNTSSSAISHSGETYKRKRATSESHHYHHPPGSPRRNRALYAQQRPQSTVVYSSRNSQLAVDTQQIPLGSSPSAFDASFLDEARIRSDSMGSKSSRCSRVSDMVDHPYENTNPNTPVVSPEGSFVSARSMTPEASRSITEEDFSETEPSDYLSMTPGHRSMTPSPTRGQSQMERSGDYLSMTPGQGQSEKSNNYLSMTPGQGERSDDYLPMTPGHRSGSPSPTRFSERLGSMGSSSQTGGGGYMDMRPGSGAATNSQDSYMDMTPPKSSSSSGGYMDMTPTTPPVHNNNGYIDMNPGQRTPTDPGPGYVMMDGAWVRTTAPIPIRVNKEPGYMDMGPSSQPLPTVKESGSGEAYLPMSPSSQGVLSSEGLKPSKVISYLSDDSMSGELPKRAYSVGSRPISKQTFRHRPPQEILRHQPLDSSKSSSAPHLIVQKPRSQFMDAVHRNQHDSYIASPLSQSVKSDDSDSFAEMEFYRPRTASDSYECRPRSSSFGKQLMPQGHRPRSSSYGQGAKGTMSKLAAGFRQDSFDSVRTTSQELSSRHRSQESLGILSSSSRNSSSDSLKKLSEGSKGKKEKTEYMDMNYDKRKTPSPNVQGVVSPKKDSTGYMDMSLGSTVSKPLSRGMSPCSSTHSLPSSAHSLGSSPASVGHGHSHLEGSHGAKVIKPSGKLISQKQSYKNPVPVSENQLKVSTSRLKKGDKRSPSSSGKESEDESYVPFKPNQAVSMTSHDDTSSILNMKNPYELTPKSHQGLKIQHGYSKSHDSGVKYPDASSTKVEKMIKGKKDSKGKSEEHHKGDKSKYKSEKEKKAKEKSSPKLDKHKSPIPEEGNSAEHAPTLQPTLAFMPDDDLFSNKIFKSNKSEAKSPAPVSDSLVKKSDDSAYMDYLPGLEDGVNKNKEPVKPVTKQFTEREYCEIDFSPESINSEKQSEQKAASDYMECDPAPVKAVISSESSPVKEVSKGSSKQPETGSFKKKRKGSSSQVDSSVVKETKKQSHNDFSYIDFDPATDGKAEDKKGTKDNAVKSPQRVPSFLAQSMSIEEKVEQELSAKEASHEAKCDKDDKCGSENKIGTDSGVQTRDNNRKCLEQKPDEVKEIASSSDGQCQNINEKLKQEKIVIEGDLDNETEANIGDNSESCVDNKVKADAENKKQVKGERPLGKLVIRHVPPLLEGEAIQDEGYCDLDFSGEKEGIIDKTHTRSESASSSNSDRSRKILESVGSEDGIPCPETPISYISEEDIPIPETPLSYISDDSTSGSSVGSRELGSPFKSPLSGRASNTSIGKMPGFGLTSFGLSGENLRKSLPTSRTYGGNQQNTGLSRQSSVPVGPTAISPRSSTEVHAYRTRKASGPACLTSQAKQGNGANGGNRLTSQGCLEPVNAGQELHKQKSMPCMIVPQNLDKIKDTENVDLVQSRHSCTDLSNYEEMNFPSSGLSAGSQIKCSSQQQLASDTGSNELHYADLDLKGSTENMDGTSPRVVKSRHPSSLDDVSKTNVQYAEIDHLKTEKMKNLNEKENVKFFC